MLRRGKLSPASILAYRADRKPISLWCARNGKHMLDLEPADVVRYLFSMRSENLSIQTMRRRLAAIRDVFFEAGKESPTMTFVVQAARREVAFGLPKRSVNKALVAVQDVRRMKVVCGDGLRGLRDRLILTLLYDCQMRRGQVAALTTKHVFAFPPVAEQAAFAWIQAANITGGPLLRPVLKGDRIQKGSLSGHSVSQIVKAKAAKIGLGAAVISSKSLRQSQL